MSPTRSVDEADVVTAEHLADVLGRLLRSLRRVHVTPIGASAMSALATVVREGPIRLGDLADREGVTPATLSRIVTVLDREGYVERRTDPDDRRAAFLLATDLGRATIAELLAVRGAALVNRMAQLSAAERAALSAGIDVLEKLIDAS
jgi:DNA-binding MarR family transcriptional regulator